MAPSPKRRVGDIGEDIACKYLVSRGWNILERNYLRPWGEIDVVAKNKDILLFVEVKTVSHSSGGDISHETFRPEENMHAGKIARLGRVIQTYLAEKKVPEDQLWRVDLACVYLDFERKKGRVEVIESVM